MKRYIVGFVAGLLFASVVPAYGAVSSLIGKKVSGELTVNVNEKEVGKAIIVDGKSYLPVRSMSDSLGLKISLNKKEVNLVSSTSNVEYIEKELEIKRSGRAGLVEFRDREIARKQETEDFIAGRELLLRIEEEALVMMAEGDPLFVGQKEKVESLKREINKNEESLEEIQATIDDYNQKISDRDIEIADLESKIQGRQ